MRIRRLDPQTVQLSELNSLGCELLHQLPRNAEVGEDSAAQERIFSSPTAGREPELDADWREYVQPGLRELFQDAATVVESDLANLPQDPEEEHCTLKLPQSHLDAWIHVLTQARLVLAARHDFTESELAGDVPIEGDGRALVLFQMHLYAFLLECLVREADRSE